MFPFYSTRLARQKFYLGKNFSSESSRVKFKNGIHSTRSSFHCFVSSEFRVLIEYFSRLNDDTLNALLITNKFYKKEKLLAKEKDLAKQKLSSKPAKAAETTETVEAVVQKSLTKNRQNIQRTSLPNDKSKTAKGSPSIKTLFQKGPGKTKASHQSKAEMEANKKKKAKKENIWTAHANSDVSDSQLNDSDETQIVLE